MGQNDADWTATHAGDVHYPRGYRPNKLRDAAIDAGFAHLKDPRNQAKADAFRDAMSKLDAQERAEAEQATQSGRRDGGRTGGRRIADSNGGNGGLKGPNSPPVDQ